MAVVQTGLFSNKYIYKNFYEMNDQEISEIEKELEEQNKKAAEQEAQNQQQMGGGLGGGASMGLGTGVAPPGAPPSPMGGGMETAAPGMGAGGAGAAPPQQESINVLDMIEKVKKYEMLLKEQDQIVNT